MPSMRPTLRLALVMMALAAVGTPEVVSASASPDVETSVTATHTNSQTVNSVAGSDDVPDSTVAVTKEAIRAAGRRHRLEQLRRRIDAELLELEVEAALASDEAANADSASRDAADLSEMPRGAEPPSPTTSSSDTKGEKAAGTVAALSKTGKTERAAPVSVEPHAQPTPKRLPDTKRTSEGTDRSGLSRRGAAAAAAPNMVRSASTLVLPSTVNNATCPRWPLASKRAAPKPKALAPQPSDNVSTLTAPNTAGPTPDATTHARATMSVPPPTQVKTVRGAVSDEAPAEPEVEANRRAAKKRIRQILEKKRNFRAKADVSGRANGEAADPRTSRATSSTTALGGSSQSAAPNATANMSTKAKVIRPSSPADAGAPQAVVAKFASTAQSATGADADTVRTSAASSGWEWSVPFVAMGLLAVVGVVAAAASGAITVPPIFQSHRESHLKRRSSVAQSGLPFVGRMGRRVSSSSFVPMAGTTLRGRPRHARRCSRDYGLPL
mmetsp:Transcript_20987/g.54634  ORF Transcript_20987/g.54634 Transcript_20987/m.54634 type:complete len:498 (-) Transcript_20987:128-1621(-)|eukprot:CAMPEP_0182925624 /NCGR_PEP_ID=MMETSP0105_2-20130417/9741_1 /TAXON_ID=81532 ORGANISM="Acanthoeca-like sp., Strain 10tr" /NCGR_SAMPLE_ID=MMETSP0105_2 /ASSEMBLY_ACC=CAM_ASM_000205 /LENGTH=497 /DNA_ID=CAMNT_0025063481 /DNA_START=170 /DNA_END=1663 /DNA_ORIENTATION=+